jgi:hypothetical protein
MSEIGKAILFIFVWRNLVATRFIYVTNGHKIYETNREPLDALPTAYSVLYIITQAKYKINNISYITVYVLGILLIA